MKKLHIEARRKLKLNREKLEELAGKLPNLLYIVYSIQYKELAEEIKKELEKRKKTRITGFSQILGCSELKTKSSILLIGEARFHALNLAISSGQEVFIFDNYSISKITNEEIEKEKRKEKGKYLKFLSSEKIGILVSAKPGQENIKSALILKAKIEKKAKSVYLFLSDNINLAELENFPCEIFINTSCPGLSLDSSRIINSRVIGKLSLS